MTRKTPQTAKIEAEVQKLPASPLLALDDSDETDTELDPTIVEGLVEAADPRRRTA